MDKAKTQQSTLAKAKSLRFTLLVEVEFQPLPFKTFLIALLLQPAQNKNEMTNENRGPELLHTHTKAYTHKLTCKDKSIPIDLGLSLLEKAFRLSKAAKSEVLSMLLVPVDYRPHVSMSQRFWTRPLSFLLDICYKMVCALLLLDIGS